MFIRLDPIPSIISAVIKLKGLRNLAPHFYNDSPTRYNNNSICAPVTKGLDT